MSFSEARGQDAATFASAVFWTGHMLRSAHSKSFLLLVSQDRLARRQRALGIVDLSRTVFVEPSLQDRIRAERSEARENDDAECIAQLRPVMRRLDVAVFFLSSDFDASAYVTMG